MWIIWAYSNWIEFPLVYVRTENVVDRTGLGYSIHWFCVRDGVETEVTQQLHQPLCAQADVGDGLTHLTQGFFVAHPHPS